MHFKGKISLAIVDEDVEMIFQLEASILLSIHPSCDTELQYCRDKKKQAFVQCGVCNS